jgi:hypothetical protein
MNTSLVHTRVCSLDRAVNYAHGTKRMAATLFVTTEALPIFETRHEMRAAIAFPNWGYRFRTDLTPAPSVLGEVSATLQSTAASMPANLGANEVKKSTHETRRDAAP